ncbi:MAG: LysR family transcriptional regulator [Rhodospirillales bacterium]|nr:LysR family transcriptional regulator [Rhodospirillales bacterium]
MEFKALETFIWISRLGSFRAAAERLNTTQPSVSSRIAALERELGTRVFDRSGRRATLTRKGRDLLRYADRLLALRNEILTAVADPAAVQGTVVLGVVETIAHTWLPKLIERVAQTYPAISLELDIDISVNLRERLVACELDAAFLMGPISRPEIVNLPLSNFPLSWLASPKRGLAGRTLTLDELGRVPIITFPRHSRPHMDLEALFHGTNVRPRIHSSSSLATIVRMAVDGIGVCALPVDIVRSELQRGELCVLESPVLLPDLYFTASFPADSDSFLVHAMCDLAVAVAKEFDSHK